MLSFPTAIAINNLINNLNAIISGVLAESIQHGTEHKNKEQRVELPDSPRHRSYVSVALHSVQKPPVKKKVKVNLLTRDLTKLLDTLNC